MSKQDEDKGKADAAAAAEAKAKADADAAAAAKAKEDEAKAPKSKLVKMVRDSEHFPAPHSADVHPDEVSNFVAGGWRAQK